MASNVCTIALGVIVGLIIWDCICFIRHEIVLGSIVEDEIEEMNKRRKK